MRAITPIPAKNVLRTINFFTIKPNNPIVEVHMTDDNGEARLQVIDVTQIFQNATAQQRTIIKAFFKQMAVLALGVADTEITGEVNDL